MSDLPSYTQDHPESGQSSFLLQAMHCLSSKHSRYRESYHHHLLSPSSLNVPYPTSVPSPSPTPTTATPKLHSKNIALSPTAILIPHNAFVHIHHVISSLGTRNNCTPLTHVSNGSKPTSASPACSRARNVALFRTSVTAPLGKGAP